MKYFVKYEVKKGDKSIIKPGLTDFNTSIELNAGQLKTCVKEWLEVSSGETVVSEVLKLGNKELVDTDVIPFSSNTGLSYILTLSSGDKLSK
jgi:hypothetical protein